MEDLQPQVPTSFRYFGKVYDQTNIADFFCKLGTYTTLVKTDELQQAVNYAFAYGARLTATSKLARRLVRIGLTLPFDVAPDPVQNIAASTAAAAQVYATSMKLVSRKREFDAKVAQKYADKYQNATSRGIEFDMTMTEFKRIMKSKTCAYTGVSFTDSGDNILTLERIDNKLGYVKGNVIAVTLAANKWKAYVLENPPAHLPQLDESQILNMLKVITQAS